jgi:hypothetical protein
VSSGKIGAAAPLRSESVRLTGPLWVKLRKTHCEQMWAGLLALTDSEMTIVFAAAQPLEVHERVAFLQEVAEALGRLPHLGDGIVHRVVADVQRRHRDVPLGKVG